MLSAMLLLCLLTMSMLMGILVLVVARGERKSVRHVRMSPTRRVRRSRRFVCRNLLGLLDGSAVFEEVGDAVSAKGSGD